MPALQIVWFKRDLRIVDHRPLAAAAERGLVLPLYVVEPEWWQQPDASERQWLFCRESLLELRQALANLGQPLVVRSGDVVQVLERAQARALDTTQRSRLRRLGAMPGRLTLRLRRKWSCIAAAIRISLRPPERSPAPPLPPTSLLAVPEAIQDGRCPTPAPS